MSFLKSQWYFFVLGFIFAVVLSGLWFKGWINDFDPGKQRPKDRLIVSLAKISDIAYLPQTLKPVNLPIYEVTTPIGELQAVLESLPEPFSNAILEGNQSKKADGDMIVDGKKYNVKLNVRGDLPNHWSLPKKSWQVTIENGQTTEGIKEFNFILPSDRGLLFESFAMHLAAKFELITPKNMLGILKINNKTQGVYYIRESYDAAMLERNRRPNGDIYKERDDPNRYDYKGQKMPGSIYLWENQSFWKKIHSGGQITPEDQSALESLLTLLKEPDNIIFQANIGHLIDLDYFFRWQALALLLGSYHQDNTHNQNLYHNPTSGKFELLPGEFILNASMELDQKHNILADRILAIPEFRKRRDEILKNYLTEENLQEDLAYFQRLYDANRTAFYKDQLKFLSNYGFDVTTKRQIDDYEQRFKNLQKTFAAQSAQTLIRFAFIGHAYPRLDQLAAIIKQANAEKPDFIVFGGDIIPGENSRMAPEKQWQQFFSAVQSSDAPIFAVPGNHDREFNRYLPTLPFAFNYHGVKFIFIDTNSAAYPQPFDLSQETIDFINRQTRNFDGIIFLFLHHAVWLQEKTVGINAFYPAKNWPEVENLLKEKTVYVLSGDGNLPLTQSNSGINYLVSGVNDYLSNEPAEFFMAEIGKGAAKFKPVVLPSISWYKQLWLKSRNYLTLLSDTMKTRTN